MRPGGGKAKGDAWERAVCAKLSLWVSNGARTDLFSRNIGSGGAFTVRTRKGEDATTPGDLMASHPMANDFLAEFSVECKAYKSLGLDGLIFRDPRSSLLGRFAEIARRQAAESSTRFLLLAKQNPQAPLWICDADVGRRLLETTAWPRKIRTHFLHENDREGALAVFKLEDVLDFTSARRFIAVSKAARI